MSFFFFTKCLHVFLFFYTLQDRIGTLMGGRGFRRSQPHNHITRILWRKSSKIINWPWWTIYRTGCIRRGDAKVTEGDTFVRRLLQDVPLSDKYTPESALIVSPEMVWNDEVGVHLFHLRQHHLNLLIIWRFVQAGKIQKEKLCWLDTWFLPSLHPNG